MARDLAPPVKVSPLIKLSRYAFLVAGILYGGSKQLAYSTLAKHKRDKVNQRDEALGEGMDDLHPYNKPYEGTEQGPWGGLPGPDVIPDEPDDPCGDEC